LTIEGKYRADVSVLVLGGKEPTLEFGQGERAPVRTQVIDGDDDTETTAVLCTVPLGAAGADSWIIHLRA